MKPHFYNVIPIFPGHEDFAISEILRQHRDVGIDRYLVSLSFHPQRTPASDLIPVLCERFRKVRDGVAGSGVELAVLVQSTLGHGWNGKVPLTRETWQHVIYFNGSENPRFCMLDPGFRDYVRDCIAAIAAEHPSLLLIDDDMGIRTGECFCPLHRAAFNKALGKDYAPEELDAILRDGAVDDPIAITVSRVLRESVVGFAKMIRETIDSVDPTMRCGLCACGGGYWENDAIVHALAGPNTKPFMRVNNATYGDAAPKALVTTFRQTKRVIYQLDGIDDVIDESDTFPHNYMSESAAMYHAHITSAMLSGLQGCKLWTSELKHPLHTGSQWRYEARLRDFRGFYDAIPDIVRGIRWQGLSGIVVRPREGYGGHPIHNHAGIYPPYGNTPIEAVYALPLRYDGIETGGIFMLRQEDVDVMTDAQLEALFANKIVVDSLAARKLTARGFAPLMGVEASEGDDDFNFNSEVAVDGSCSSGYMWDDSTSQLKPVADGVEVVAEFCRGERLVNPQPVAPSHTLFTNKLGGRVAVIGWHLDLVFYKMFIPRHRQLFIDLLDKLNGSPLEMIVESGEQEFVRHGILADGSELLSVTRLSYDADESFPLRLVRTPKSVERLSPKGEWEPIKFTRKDQSLVEINAPLVCCEPIVLRLAF